MSQWKLRAGHVAAMILALSVVLPLPAQGRIGGLPSICLTQLLLGIPCPFCGLTRSFVCMGHGKWHEAVAFHLLGPIMFVLTGILAVSNFSPRKWRLPSSHSRPLTALAAAIIGAVWIARLCGFWPIPSS